MAYSNQTLTKLTNKKFIIGMITAGVFTVGLAAPAAASAISLGGEPSSNGIVLGAIDGGSLQGSSWSAQGYDNSNDGSQAWSTNKSEITASGNSTPMLHVQSNEDDDMSGSASAASQENSSTTTADLQGGIGLNVSASSSADVSSKDQASLLNL